MDLTLVVQLGGLFLTLSILLYLIVGDNALFRLVTYTFVGVASGYVFVVVIAQVLYPRLVSLFEVASLTGSVLFLGFGLVPFFLGLFVFTKLFSSSNVLGSLPMGILVGIGAAVVVGGAVFGTLFGQIDGTLAPIPSLGELFSTPPADSQLASPISRLVQGAIMIVGLVSTLAYFQFGVRSRNTGAAAEEVTTARRTGIVELLAKIGQVFIGITLGAVFAGVYTAAISALVERIGFIFDVVATLIF